MASQPAHGWYQGTFETWSRHAGLIGLVHDLALWHGVLAFGFGLVLGMSFDTVPVAAPVATPAPARRIAEEPVTAERRELDTAPGQPHEVTVGPHRD